MRIMLKSAVILSLFTQNTYALQESIVGSDSEVECVVSNKELNRIKVTNDRIRAVRVNSGEIEILEDKYLGEVYLKTLIHNPINMFVTTEKGYTYKLNLVPKKHPSEQIILTNIALIHNQKQDLIEASDENEI